MASDLFRKEYTPLTDEQKKEMQTIKGYGEVLLTYMDEVVPREERSERSRCMAIARTHLETAVMFAVKAVTTKQE